ncbi:hypothetical protein SAMN05216315_10978 [Nitrosospira sp. Nsp18]|uniref:hypothetical protein n=1 Tax=Nitrosospira sp. Nsp18 TaxID=1855334 RepID=UPI000886F7EB|nr:hypothetical protein [Nitrosospira sp. Nsp18]SDA17779.1 hypothetical protein SAMN05216315_10978 [Nitrosospira sp. Nsp18]
MAEYQQQYILEPGRGTVHIISASGGKLFASRDLREADVIMQDVILAYGRPGDSPRGIAMNPLEAYG